MKMYQADSVIITILAVALTLPGVSAHVALWNKAMFGFNWPNQVGDNVTNWNQNKANDPLREFEGFGIDQWFGHGFKSLPPAVGEFMILPAGGTYQGELWCGRGGTTFRNPSDTSPLTEYACRTEGPLHVANTFGQPVDDSKFGGTALAIAYTSNVASLQPNDMTVISVKHRSPWERGISYSIPAGLPPCPEGGCLCTWNWIHQSSSKEGYGNEIYNNLYRCKVTGSTGTTNVVQRGQVPRECGSNRAGCVKGPKVPMYIYQAEGNNLPRQNPPPNYRSNWGFEDGAQNDIFVAGSSPAPTTYLDNAYATGTATTRVTPAPTATGLPSGWTAVGCMVDDPNFRALNSGGSQTSNLTIEACVASCASKGSIFAGVENGIDCWCGSRLQGTAAPASECDVRCSGDQWAFCGGRNRINVFRSSAAPTTYAPAPTPIAASALPTGWSAQGCYQRGPAPQGLDGGTTSYKGLTVPMCLASCAAKGMPWAGLENGSQCWCGRSYDLVAATSGCNVRCSGDDSVICGGGYRINLFHTDAQLSSSPASITPVKTSSTTTSFSTTTKLSTTTTLSADTATTKPSTTYPTASPTPLTSMPAGWRSLGCFVDLSTKRVLNGSYSESSTSMTVQSCMATCRSQSFAYAGVQHGRQCFCGKSMTSAKLAPSECTLPCTGDRSLICGGNYRMNVYAFTPSTAAKRNVFGQAMPVAMPPATSETSDRFEGRMYPLPMRIRRP